MPRYKIKIEYDGTPFVGWQQQANGVSVQEEIAKSIFAFCAEAVQVQGAGRTDSGVHASGQVAHFDLEKDWQSGRVREALNYHLRPNPIAIVECEEVDGTFNARFSATMRHYTYRILNRRAPAALFTNRVWWVPRELDVSAMANAAGALEGHHDFTTFRASICQAKSPMRTLDHFSVHGEGDDVFIRASARSFLHNQVRSMVGSLKLVGEGKWSREDLAGALKRCDRTACGPVAPACGLYLTGVDYCE